MNREGVVYGMGEAEYHGYGEFAGMFNDELSSTRAKLVLESPAKLHYQLTAGRREPRDAFNVGTAVHSKVLGTGAVAVTCPPELLDKTGGMRTAAAKEWKAEQEALGVPVVSVDALETIDGMAESVLAHPLAKMLFERPGKAEASVFDEFLGVKRRGRFDYLPDDGGIAVDLKTTVDASKAGFARSAANYGYHIQRGHYLHILKRLGREMDMLFVAVEKAAPYLVAVHQVSPEFADMGEQEALEAVDVFGECVRSGEWPGYPVEINVLEPPMYAVYDFQDKYEREEIQV